jgi:hypothetical protein
MNAPVIRIAVARSALGALAVLLCLGCRPGKPGLAGNSWRLERMVRLSFDVPIHSTRTQRLAGDSLVDIRLVMGAASGNQIPGTLVITKHAKHETQTFEVNATESVDGQMTVTLPPGALTSERAGMEGRRLDERLILLGDHSAAESYLDSLVFRRVEAGAAADSEVTVVERGDSLLRATVLASALKSDLRNLIVAEEAYFADNIRYTARSGPGGLNFYASSGNMLPIVTLTKDGWAATMSNTSRTMTCAIYVGSTSIAPATKEGEPKCQ